MKCKVENGILEPCDGVKKLIGARWQKGLSKMEISNVETGKVSRSGLVLISGSFESPGCFLNYCPVCGAKISDHL